MLLFVCDTLINITFFMYLIVYNKLHCTNKLGQRSSDFPKSPENNWLRVDVFITLHRILIAETLIMKSRLKESRALLMNSLPLLDDRPAPHITTDA